MRVLLGRIFTVLTAAILFIITQYLSDATVGCIDWFFTNLPSSIDPWDFPVLYIISQSAGDFVIQWLPITCLAFSILLFMKKKKQWAYLLIVAPLLPAITAFMIFYYAAQIHVPPGQGLIGSGVMIGKIESYTITKERAAKEKMAEEEQNAD